MSGKTYGSNWTVPQLDGKFNNSLDQMFIGRSMGLFSDYHHRLQILDIDEFENAMQETAEFLVNAVKDVYIFQEN